MFNQLARGAAACVVAMMALAAGGAGPGATDAADALAGAPADVKTALDLAIEDERHAIALYERVMATHGERGPFVNIVRAERRHETALLEQYRRLGLAPPPDTRSGRRLDVPATFREACDAAEFAEIENIRLYDELLAGVEDDGVREVFRRLRSASADRHLPAFRRHGSGWHVLTGAPSPSQQAQASRAAAARDDLFSTLVGRVVSEMRANGTAGAIPVCKEEAPRLAARAAETHGLAIGRTSWKLRNPKNTGPGWGVLVLDDRPETTRLLADRTGRLGYVAPIRIMSTCLACHGPRNTLAPEVRERLDTLYPADQATGFEKGDLRGWFWVEVPAAPATSPPAGR